MCLFYMYENKKVSISICDCRVRHILSLHPHLAWGIIPQMYFSLNETSLSPCVTFIRSVEELIAALCSFTSWNALSQGLFFTFFILRNLYSLPHHSCWGKNRISNDFPAPVSLNIDLTLGDTQCAELETVTINFIIEQGSTGKNESYIINIMETHHTVLHCCIHVVMWPVRCQCVKHKIKNLNLSRKLSQAFATQPRS